MFSFRPYHLLPSPFLLLPRSRNSDPGLYSRRFHPLSTKVRALHSYEYLENTSALSSLVNSGRIAPTHEVLLAVDSLLFFWKFTSHYGGIRTLTNASSVRDQPLNHRGDRLSSPLLVDYNLFPLIAVFSSKKYNLAGIFGSGRPQITMKTPQTISGAADPRKFDESQRRERLLNPCCDKTEGIHRIGEGDGVPALWYVSPDLRGRGLEKVAQR